MKTRNIYICIMLLVIILGVSYMGTHSDSLGHNKEGIDETLIETDETEETEETDETISPADSGESNNAAGSNESSTIIDNEDDYSSILQYNNNLIENANTESETLDNLNNPTTSTNSATSNISGMTGVSKDKIPAGQEDLYVLKSSVIAPVCPKTKEGPCCKEKKPPPCPPCARCPEPSFECKKVPNYTSPNVSQYAPRPVLADFSQFGM